jgi:hypothetical protein
MFFGLAVLPVIGAVRLRCFMSVARNLPRSFSSAGVKVSFFGIAS